MPHKHGMFTNFPLQVSADLQHEVDKGLMLEADLRTTSSSLEAELGKAAEKEEELKILRSCLHQVTEKAITVGEVLDGGSDEDKDKGGEEEEEGEEEGGGRDREDMISKEAQLEKIQAMLDTTKVEDRRVLCMSNVHVIMYRFKSNCTRQRNKETTTVQSSNSSSQTLRRKTVSPHRM